MGDVDEIAISIVLGRNEGKGEGVVFHEVKESMFVLRLGCQDGRMLDDHGWVLGWWLVWFLFAGLFWGLEGWA